MVHTPRYTVDRSGRGGSASAAIDPAKARAAPDRVGGVEKGGTTTQGQRMKPWASPRHATFHAPDRALAVRVRRVSAYAESCRFLYDETCRSERVSPCTGS